MSTLELTPAPGSVDPRIEVTGYVQGDAVYGNPALRSLIVHTTGSLWPLMLEEWSVAAALHCADVGAVATPDTDLDDLARLVLRGVQVAGWLRVGSMGSAADDIGWRIDHNLADTEDHLMVIEAWGSDQCRRACHLLARVLCTSEHTEILREVPGHGHCPTLAEVAGW